MYSKEMEALIEVTLQDGVLTDQEKAVLVKRAQNEGIDLEELDVYIQSLLQKRHQSEAEEDARRCRDSKIGSLKKCPNCGGIIQPGWSACPYCGMAFTEVAQSTAYEKFSSVVSVGLVPDLWRGSSHVVDERASFIESFQVPGTRVDLLEFLNNIKPKCDATAKPVRKQRVLNLLNLDWGYSYWILFQNIISKARRNFLYDPEFKEFFEFANIEMSKEAEARESSKKGFFSRLFGK